MKRYFLSALLLFVLLGGPAWAGEWSLAGGANWMTPAISYDVSAYDSYSKTETARLGGQLGGWYSEYWNEMFGYRMGALLGYQRSQITEAVVLSGITGDSSWQIESVVVRLPFQALAAPLSNWTVGVGPYIDWIVGGTTRFDFTLNTTPPSTGSISYSFGSVGWGLLFTTGYRFDRFEIEAAYVLGLSEHMILENNGVKVNSKPQGFHANIAYYF